jgi:hypothetical protein
MENNEKGLDFIDLMDVLKTINKNKRRRINKC